MWRSKDHRSAGLGWSLLSSGGGHGSLGCDFFVSVGAAVDQSVMQSTATSGPCIILVVISFITHYGWRHRRLFLWLGLVVNRWVIRGGPLGGVKDQFLPLFWAAVDHVFWNHLAHVHRAKWEGKWCLKATFPSPFQMFQAVSLCGRLRSRSVFDEMPERDVFAWTTIVSAHIRAGDLSSARRFFEEMPERNTATWNTMIDGYARMGNFDSAELLFDQMPGKDIISWTTMVSCYSQHQKFREALAVFNEMMSKGIHPDEVTLATIISACAHLGALDLGKEIHLYILQNGFDLDVYIGSALIDMYAKCGNLDRSLSVFFKLQEKNLFCWNSVIDGLAVHGYANEALKMFRRMEREKMKPNGITFISVLSACTHAGLVNEGRRMFLSMTDDYSIPPEVGHYGCMVDLLSKAGLLKDALKLIRSMKVKPNSIIWGALFGGCKLHRNLEIAQVAVNELLILEPNNSGHHNLLVNMYAEVNRWGEVAKMRAAMKNLGVEKKCPGSSWIEMEKEDSSVCSI
uniref:Pentacotripeptide-repeat region of PRORP domain-containing protein n=1 Tax=Fagus sylvatica TaxID=28930 RepID=A0A2N9GYI2_FAGSY